MQLNRSRRTTKDTPFRARFPEISEISRADGLVQPRTILADIRSSSPVKIVPTDWTAREIPSPARSAPDESCRLEAGLTWRTVAKSRFSCVDQLGIRAALEHLGQERAAGIEHVGGKRRRRLRRGRRCAADRSCGGRWCWAPCRTARRRRGRRSSRSALSGASSARKSSCAKVDAGDFRHLQQIDRDHLALAVGRADALGRDLAPAAGGGAEIDHASCRA